MKKSVFSVLMAGLVLHTSVYANPTAEVAPQKTPTPPSLSAVQKSQVKSQVKSQASKNVANGTSNKRAANAAANNTTASKNKAVVNRNTGGNETVMLQMGAFTDPSLAYKQAAKASLLGLPARVVHMKNRNGDVVRVVRSSARLKQADAENIAADLREQEVNVLLMQ